MKIDYERLTEITVKSQAEFDMIPDGFKGRIYIEFGTFFNRAIVNRSFEFSVVARENSSVVARGNSSVEANGNVQVVNRQLSNGRIEISGNARIVFMPKTIEEFMSFYGIKHDKKTAVFFKAVHRTKDGYVSDYDPSFKYQIGATIRNKCDTDVNDDCSYGIHIAHPAWCLDFGRDWNNLAIIAVETDISNIVLPNDTSGKVRTSEIKVLHEVPLETLGIFGKILAKRIAKNTTNNEKENI